MSFLVFCIAMILTVSMEFYFKPGAALAPIISTVANRAYNGEEMRGERVNGTNSGESGQAQASSGINVTASAAPSRPAIVSTSGDVQPGAGVSQASDSNPISSIIAEITAQLRRIPANRQNENHAPSGMHTVQYASFCLKYLILTASVLSWPIRGFSRSRPICWLWC